MNKEINDLITDFVAEGGDFRNWRPSYNVAPTQTIPVIIQSAKGGNEVTRRLGPARWSLVPSW
jgi:putative SOS response-associated peptidase YedK